MAKDKNIIQKKLDEYTIAWCEVSKLCTSVMAGAITNSKFEEKLDKLTEEKLIPLKLELEKLVETIPVSVETLHGKQ